MSDCRFPFTDCTGCERCARADRLTEIDSSIRRQHARIAIQAIALAAVSFIIIFAAGYVGAAIVTQGVDNIKEWKVQHEPV